MPAPILRVAYCWPFSSHNCHKGGCSPTDLLAYHLSTREDIEIWPGRQATIGTDLSTAPDEWNQQPDTCQYQLQFTLAMPHSECNNCILFICHCLAHIGQASG